VFSVSAWQGPGDARRDLRFDDRVIEDIAAIVDSDIRDDLDAQLKDRPSTSAM